MALRVATVASVFAAMSCALIADVPDGRLAPDTAGSGAGAGVAAGGGNAGGGGAAGGGPTTSGVGGASGGGSAYADAVLADGPVAYWRLGEVRGRTVAVDASPSGYDATYEGQVDLDVKGALAGDRHPAVHFEPAAEVDAGDVLAFDGTLPYTLEAWIEPDGAATQFLFGRAIYGDFGAGRNFYGYYVTLVEGVLGASRGPSGISISGAPAPAGRFSHVVVVYDGDLSIYQNGRQQISVGDGSAISGPVAKFQIAQNANWDGFRGTIDEVAVYDKPLAYDRILAHYEIGLGGR